MSTTDKTISRIGLGCVTFGREIDRDASFAMMDHAVANGITLFDTAAAYGAGASEQIVGDWLASNRVKAGSITVATKVLPPYDDQHLVDAVDASLKRLSVDYIDILYLHRWDPFVATAGTLEALEGLVRAGKVRTLGASNFAVEQLDLAVLLQKEYGFSAFRFAQNNHNLAVSDCTPAFRYVCRLHGIDIITYSPLGAGFLTGKHQQGVQPGSRFDVVKGHQGVYFNDAAWRRLRRLQAVAAQTGYDPVLLALAWALHQPVTSTLVGGRTPAHLNQALAALSFNAPEILTELEYDEE
jgi:1-deoxyxylulose-5-phosphate synthase